MAPLSCRRRWSLLFVLVVLAVLMLSSNAVEPKAADKPNKKAKAKSATSTKKEQQQQKQKAKAQPQQKKPEPQQKAQQQKGQQKAQQQKQKQQKAKRQAQDEAMEDTTEMRHYHATRVLQGTPLIETLEGLVQEAARVKGPEAAEEIRQAISKSDTRALSQVMQKAYASTFTAAELAFIADYSNSEIGKRVQRKMSQYVAKVTPAMEAFTKEVFSGKAMQGEGHQGQDQGPEWQQQQATHSSEGTTIVMNSEKAKEKKKKAAAAAAAAKKAAAAGINSAAGEL